MRRVVPAVLMVATICFLTAHIIAVSGGDFFYIVSLKILDKKSKRHLKYFNSLRTDYRLIIRQFRFVSW